MKDNARKGGKEKERGAEMEGKGGKATGMILGVAAVAAVLVFHIAAGIYHKRTGVYLTPMHTGLPFMAVHAVAFAAIAMLLRRRVAGRQAARDANAVK